VVEADPGPEHCNGGGIVHGGFLAALLDTTTGWAVHARVPAGTAAPHVQLSVQYVRAAVPGTPLVCRGRATGVGRRIGSTDAEITQDGRVVARAVASHAVLADR
jgi:acyl-CoA thioesterase